MPVPSMVRRRHQAPVALRPAALMDPTLLERLFTRAAAGRWALPSARFAEALAASASRAFDPREPTPPELERYLGALHLTDLALACACALGQEAAWDHFVREYRPILYRAADALDPSGGARELADALYADLYGVGGLDGDRASLFRYFHGRSSLATWLRAVVAQRHVDALRVRRRTEPLPDDETLTPAVPRPESDPDRPRLRQAMRVALGAAIALLAPQDRLRLRSYYVAGLTLAQIGRLTREHEATVSRHLKRTRGLVRRAAERHLREDARLSPTEIARCFELAVEVDPDATVDLQELFGMGNDRKNDPLDRST